MFSPVSEYGTEITADELLSVCWLVRAFALWCACFSSIHRSFI